MANQTAQLLLAAGANPEAIIRAPPCCVPNILLRLLLLRLLLLRLLRLKSNYFARFQGYRSTLAETVLKW